LADEGIAYAGLLAHAGAPVEHHHLPRHAHGLFTSAGLISTGAKLFDRAANWLVELASLKETTG
jgi:acetyl esterase